MKPLHATLAAAVLAVPAMFLPAAFAQAAHGHDHVAVGMDAPASPQGATGDGEVRRIDLAHHKVTLRHEASKEMNMPGMTMVYEVASPALLTRVKVGDKVRFHMTSVGGKMTVTQLQPVR